MRPCFFAALAGLALAPPLLAQDAPELPGAVPAFETLCLTGGVDPTARPAALEAAGWQKSASTSFDTKTLGISKAIEQNYDFSKPELTEQWSGQIDGRPATMIIARFAAKRRYPNICALVIEGVRNAMPYDDALKAAFERFGIKRKSVDLVHYFEFSGKVGSDKHPVRGEIFTRSRATGGRDTMHLYVAY